MTATTLRASIALALAVASLAGCATSSLTSTAPGGQRLSALSGDDAIELSGVRVKVIDNTRKQLAARQLMAVPTFTSWTDCVVRLHNDVALTDDRTAVLPQANGWTQSGGSYFYNGGATLFTRLRPTSGYKVEVSLLDGTQRSLSTSAIGFDLEPGTMTKLVVTMNLTADGTGLSVNVTSAGKETYAGVSGEQLLKNSTAPLAGGNNARPLVIGDDITVSASLADTAAAASQTASQSDGTGTTKVNNVANLMAGAVLGRVTASVVNGVTSAANGAVLTIGGSNNIASNTVTAIPNPANETIVANWFKSGNEPISGLAYYAGSGSYFFDDTHPGSQAGLNSLAFPALGTNGTISNASFNQVGFGSSVDWPASVPPGGTAATSESNLGNATMIFRYYSSAYDHHLITAKKGATLNIESGANLGLQVN